MSASCVTMSCATLPVTMFAFGAAEPSGVQPIRPPPPSPTDSGLPPDSPSTQDATPAAAALEYPLSTRYWPIASRLLPLAMSACTVELSPDEDGVLVLPWEDAWWWRPMTCPPWMTRQAVRRTGPTWTGPTVDRSHVDRSGAVATTWSEGIVSTWPAQIRSGG